MARDFLSDSILAGVPILEGYRVLAPCFVFCRLGVGGMGAVFRGRHLNLDIEVAVKCMKGQVSGDESDFISRFQREARLAASVNHPNLTRVYDVCERHGLHYIVMEYVLGETARERVERKGRLDPDEAAALMLDASRGLAAAHALGVVHRDVKPDNLLVSTAGDVKVADLGLAKAAGGDDTVTTGTHVVMGTPQFMPPEQFEGAAKVGPAGDVHALGATLYFLLLGENPFPGASSTEVWRRVCLEPFPDLVEQRPDLPEQLVAMVRRATAKDPADRYPDAMAFAADLEDFLAGRSVTLADPDAGQATARCSALSPPPRAAMSAIKEALSSGALQDSIPPTELQTQPEVATKTNIGSRPRRVPAALGAAAAVLVLAGLAFTLGGGGGDPGLDSEMLFRQAQSDLRSEGTQDIGIRKLEEIFARDPGFQEVRPALASALRSKADRLRATGDLGLALEVVDRARGLQDSVGMSELRAEIAGGIREKLDASVRLQEEPGEAMHGPVVAVLGTVGYPGTVTVTVGEVEVPLRDGSFERALELEDGSHTVKILVRESHGITVERELAFTLDSTAPQLVVDPFAGWAQSPILLTGRVTDMTVTTLTVDTGRVVVGKDGKWEIALSLEDGAHDVVVVAEDQAKNRTEQRLTLRVDSTGPEVRISQPEEGVLTKADQLTLVARVGDGGSLASVTVGGRTVEPDAEGMVRAECPLEEGSQRLLIVARDHAGNETRREVAVRCDRTAPKIEILSPAPGSRVPPGNLQVRLRYEDDHPGIVEVLGRKFEVEPGEQTLELTGLGGGEKVLTATATDAAGNQAPSARRDVHVHSWCESCERSGSCPGCKGAERDEACSDCRGARKTVTPCGGCRGGVLPCPDCKRGQRAAPCGGCAGSGNVPCARCRGGGQLRQRCDNCRGRGTIGQIGPVPIPCPGCGGDGEKERPCDRCQQKGVQPCRSCRGRGNQIQRCLSCRGRGTRGPCGICRGTGEIHSPCVRCEGKGRVPRTCSSCQGSGTCPDCHGKTWREQ